MCVSAHVITVFVLWLCSMNNLGLWMLSSLDMQVHSYMTSSVVIGPRPLHAGPQSSIARYLIWDGFNMHDCCNAHY